MLRNIPRELKIAQPQTNDMTTSTTLLGVLTLRISIRLALVEQSKVVDVEHVTLLRLHPVSARLSGGRKRLHGAELLLRQSKVLALVFAVALARRGGVQAQASRVDGGHEAAVAAPCEAQAGEGGLVAAC